MFLVLIISVLSLFELFASKYDSLNVMPVKAVRISAHDLKFDGLVSEPAWGSKPVERFVQRDPDEGKPATEPTQIWIAYDENYLYIAAKMYDSIPERIDRSLGRRDSYLSSDWIYVYLDPFLDKKTGYYFAVNPAGVMADGVFYNDGWNDNTWDGIWEVETVIDGAGWSAEFRIPFSQLRFNESASMVWGVNFSREIKRKKEDSYYVMVPKKESGFVSRFARLEGLEDIKAKKRFEVMPYLVQKAQYLLHDTGDPFYKSKQYDNAIGADFKFGIGSNINVDGTINPDFGQVEVDPAVMNLSAFESYFSEKRPFFIEGSNIFYFGMDGANNNWGFNFGTPELFYSRRIGRAPRGGTSSSEYTDYPSSTRILGAAKLSGKFSEGLTMGAITAVTERTRAKLWNNGAITSEEVEPLTHYGVFRIKKELNESRQMLGLIFTTVNRDVNSYQVRQDIVKNSFVFGVDGYTFLDDARDYVITGLIVGSYLTGSESSIASVQQHPVRYLQRPDAEHFEFDPNRTSLSGVYTRFMLNKQSGNFYINSAIGAVTPGMDYNDIGFQGTADRINGHLVLGYRWYEPYGIFRNSSLYVSHAQSYDFGGDNTNRAIWFMNQYNFTNYWGISLNGSYSFKTLTRSATRGGPMIVQPADYYIGAYVYSDSRKPLTVEFGGNYSYGFDNSYYRSFNTYLNWKPESRLSLSIGPSFSKSVDSRQWVANISDATAINTFSTRYVFGKIEQSNLNADIRIDYTFTPKLSLQIFAQPFSAVGKYSEFKEISRPRSEDFLIYGEGISTIDFSESSNEYHIDPDGAGNAAPFTVSNPNFNFKSLRGNVVLRWEALPGSILYFVWSHDQMNFDDAGELNIRRDFRNLLKSEGNDIFLVKFTYWWDV
ncbi:MAG: carbohydrate binding family 9 domain-containing protein [Ignavibacteriaceae bacterium]|nr:carbohydrate binding family 9 domain-containing protein [Ignavibacteriaceae bacterium]